MGYWGEVRQRALKAALKAATLDTGAGWVRLILTAAATLGTGLFFSGSSADAWLKVMGTVSVPLAIAMLFLSVEIIATPPKMASEQASKIIDLETALAVATARPKPVDLVKARGLLTRLSHIMSRARGKFGGSSESKYRAARLVYRDLTELLGVEVAEDMAIRHPGAFDPPGAVGSTDFLDPHFKAIGLEIGEMAKNLTLDQLSSERADLAEFIDGRLEQLRMES